MVNKQAILDFKAAVKQVLGQEELNAGVGLCYELSEVTGSATSSYDVMNSVLAGCEYGRGLGPHGEFTKERRQFLIFLDCLSVEDIADFMEHANAY